ncbi:NAD(P)/FAD-dependent oxidoreductase [Tautonia marina]|uniref:NAD(P)/FAD-dependent oxidoreductase n=1 Tax=Tautonia marina TaxID=2653855 RepID=UPI0012610886|nr:NAD(P)/FAD-dependent oxidoreductase [Tautonia marina]
MRFDPTELAFDTNSLDAGRPFDAAIVGAGPSGSAMAILLARAGARVALIDAGRFPRDKLCGEYLSPEGVEAVERLVPGDRLARSGGRPIRSVRLTTPRGRTLEAEVAGPDGRVGLGLSRSALDALLLDEARSLGVSVFEGTRISGPILQDGRVVGVSGRGESGRPVAARASVVVAADGRHSAQIRRSGTTRARSLPGLRPRLFGLKRHLTVSDPASDEPSGTVGLHLLPGGYVGACRVEGGRTNLCGLLPERLSRQYRGDLDALADATFSGNRTLSALWQAAEPTGPWKTVAGVRVETSSPRLPGIFSSGDARGTVDPLGGQGLTMAMLGAEVIAPFVLRALARNDEGPAALRAAQRAWHARFDRRVTLCRAFHHALVQPSLIDVASLLGRWGNTLLSLGFAATRDPVRISC